MNGALTGLLGTGGIFKAARVASVNRNPKVFSNLGMWPEYPAVKG